MILFVAAILFGIGILIALTRKNAMLVLMGIELMLTASMLNFIAFSRTVESHLFVLLIIVVAAAEITIALVLILKIYKYFGQIEIDKIVEKEN
ncbi:NADH:ubiquinone oxidoreductase subunit 11 or 4L (chain K) [Bernardetia litoralis DSM 6794]|uniref:NADH-quinone oxidoreductase subunit K n=1 Tax=Bernardetia litoralis (strain ATCC 23117 / DSM 6794 / NBRC 15988 / NCIMB 1366 / Fx l1 / Sio-4) TaxID=880071 RepID=I4AR03_BERLS|nr:NADH-quinone oxidoreductase subunit NuoK [Bernardetia litoralis]AFM06388.1 NADH:ubiquinone oxidoreductase subunit 11 or 4L (chain K) [Bernardetia litoralis DSM 6794]